MNKGDFSNNENPSGSGIPSYRIYTGAITQLQSAYNTD